MSLYQAPPVTTHVVWVDEMGLTTVKTSPAARWSQERPHIEADYGRRGKVWTVGAFEPHTGRALTCCMDGRTSANFLRFLDQIVATWEGKIVLILDNLSIHKTLDVLLWELVHPQGRFRFQPTYAPWLTWIAPWWKTLRSLALKGRRFETLEELIHAIADTTTYWNLHPKPYLWRKTVAQFTSRMKHLVYFQESSSHDLAD